MGFRESKPNGECAIMPDVVSELAPNGTLRAGVNLSNFLLVTGKTETGDPNEYVHIWV